MKEVKKGGTSIILTAHFLAPAVPFYRSRSLPWPFSTQVIAELNGAALSNATLSAITAAGKFGGPVRHFRPASFVAFRVLPMHPSSLRALRGPLFRLPLLSFAV
jgi:hypothetical protein